MNEVVIPLKLSGVAALKAELKDLKNALANATDPAQMTALAQKAGEVADQIKDVNEQINTFATGSKFEQVSNSFANIQGDLMAMDFEGAAEKSKTFATALGGINKADIGKAIGGITSMIGTLSKAFIKLGMTILVNPIFLIVAAVVAIIAVIALVLKSFGVLDDVIKALMAPINALIAGFKALTDWLGLTAFAAEDNAAKTLAANEKVTKSSEERTARVTGDLGREIAEAKAAGEDTTKLEEELSNTKIKEANKRKQSAKEALDAQKKLGDDADLKKIEDLKKQVAKENEIIKQGYSEKTIAKNTADKKESDDADKKEKEASDKAKIARDKRIAADKASEAEIAAARKIVTDSAKTAQQIELDDLAASYATKIATATKYKNDTTALVEAQKIQEAAINKKYDDEAKTKTAAAMASSHAANIAKIDAYNAELAALTDTEEQKLYDKYEADKIKFADNELALFNLSKKYAEDTTALKKTEADKQKAIDDAALQAKKSIISSEIDAAKGLVNLLAGLGEKNKKIQKAALIANSALSIAEIINNTNVGSAKEVATKGILGLSTSAILYTKMAISIASVVAATAKGLSALGGGSVTAPSNTGGGGGGGGTSTTAVAPASGPSLFGNANTGSQVTAGGGTNNITVTAVVSETEITASQNHINNIQQNSVL